MVDYGTVSPCLFTQISHFRVGHFLPVHSVHSLIDIPLQVYVTLAPPDPPYVFVCKPDKKKWRLIGKFNLPPGYFLSTLEILIFVGNYLLNQMNTNE